MMIRQVVGLKQGLEQDIAKKVIKIIKDSKMKVEAAIQEKQIRVTGKNIDDLQSVIALLKQNQSSLGIPLQYTNMRR